MDKKIEKTIEEISALVVSKNLPVSELVYISYAIHSGFLTYLYNLNKNSPEGKKEAIKIINQAVLGLQEQMEKVISEAGDNDN